MIHRESISSLIEDYHLGRKPRVSFPGGLIPPPDMRFFTRMNNYEDDVINKEAKSVPINVVQRISHLYIKTYMVSEQTVSNVTETTVICDKEKMNLFFGDYSFADTLKREPDLIITYDIMKNIRSYSDYTRLVKSSEECLSPLMVNVLSTDSRVLAYSTTATELRDFEDCKTMNLYSELTPSNGQTGLDSKPNKPTSCFSGLFGFFKNVFKGETCKDEVETPLPARGRNESVEVKTSPRYSSPIISNETASEGCRGGDLQDDARNSLISYSSDDDGTMKETLHTCGISLPYVSDKAGQTYIFMKINIHKALAHTKDIKNLLLHKSLNFYLPKCKVILLKRHIELYFRRPIIKCYQKKDDSECSYEISEEQCSSGSDIYIPRIDLKARILTEEIYISLNENLPFRARLQDLKLAYSTEVHGTCLNTMYKNALEYADNPCIIIFKENTGNIFGAILSDIPFESNSYYGSGCCCVFRYDSAYQNINTFKWASRNNWFMIGDRGSFRIGGGGAGASIWISEDLVHGRSCSSATFMNEQLSDNEDFSCFIVELWIFK